jgi:hypothetical protein
MRKSFSAQRRLDCDVIENVRLNLECRDEIIPILVALQHIYSTADVRDEILRLIASEYQEQAKNASVRFREARQRHPGIESAIGALQSGNALDRCRDRTDIGFERYIALGILGRNLHVLGKLLIQQTAPDANAGQTRRKSAA